MVSPSDAALPRVIVYDIATADGRVALSPGRLLMDDPRWPRYAEGGYATVWARHAPDALLEGAGTFVPPAAAPLEWPAGATVEPGDYLPADIVAAAPRWFAATDSRGRVRWPFTELPLAQWAGTRLIVLVSKRTPAGYRAYLRSERIPYLVAGDDRVDLRAALATMRARLGVTTLVATCGGELGGALLRAGLVDQVEIEVVPLVAGGRTTPALFSSAELGDDEPPTRLRLMDTTTYADGRVLLSYAVERAATTE